MSPAPAVAPVVAQVGFGQVRHTRLRPRRHAFAYDTWFLLLPMRTLATDPAAAGALAYNRAGLISFHDRDHGDGRGPGQGGALAWMQELLRAEGIHDADGEASTLGAGDTIFGTHGQITHFVSAMGTTGTITGVSRYLKEKNPNVRIIGAQPSEGSRIPGIRKWPQAYLPKIYDSQNVDELVYVSQDDAEDMCRRLAREEGIFAGISAAGACWVALQIAQQVENAIIAFIVCDRGDRYLSTGVFPA